MCTYEYARETQGRLKGPQGKPKVGSRGLQGCACAPFHLGSREALGGLQGWRLRPLYFIYIGSEDSPDKSQRYIRDTLEIHQRYISFDVNTNKKASRDTSEIHKNTEIHQRYIRDTFRFCSVFVYKNPCVVGLHPRAGGHQPRPVAGGHQPRPLALFRPSTSILASPPIKSRCAAASRRLRNNAAACR